MRKRKSAVVSTLPPAAAAATRAGLADRVYDILRSQIFARQLIAGSKLNIDQIARELAVSATPVREAVNRLVAERLAVYEPYQGYSLAPSLNLQELEQVMALRELLEAFAAREGAAKIGDDDLRAMTDCADEMKALARQTGYLVFKRFEQRDNEFHDLIIRSANNAFLVDSYRAISLHIRMARIYYAGGGTDMAAVVVEHRAILEAYQRRDGAQAAALLSRHLLGARGRLSTMVADFMQGTADLRSALHAQCGKSGGGGR